MRFWLTVWLLAGCAEDSEVSQEIQPSDEGVDVADATPDGEVDAAPHRDPPDLGLGFDCPEGWRAGDAGGCEGAPLPECPEGALALPTGCAEVRPCPEGWARIPGTNGCEPPPPPDCEGLPYPGGCVETPECTGTWTSQGVACRPPEAACAECAFDLEDCGEGPFAEVDWPEGTVFVDAAAPPGGDGSRARPLQALREAPTIALAAGRYAVEAPIGGRVIGRCPARTVLLGDPEASALERLTVEASITAAAIELEEVRLLGTLRLGAGESAFEGVLIEPPRGPGLELVDGRLLARRLVIRGAEGVGLRATGGSLAIEGGQIEGTRPTERGAGVFLVRAQTSLTDVDLRANARAGLVAEGGGVDLVRVWTRDTQPDTDGQGGEGLILFDGALTLDEVASTRNRTTGLTFVGGTVRGSRVLVEDIEARAGDGVAGFGVEVSRSAEVDLRRLEVSQTRSRALLVVGATAHLTEFSLARAPRGVVVDVGEDAHLALERGAITGGGYGLQVRGALRATAVHVRGSRFEPGQERGVGLAAFVGEVWAEDLQLSDHQGAALAAYQGAQVDLIRPRLLDNPSEYNAALMTWSGARIRVEDAYLQGNPQVGMVAIEPGSRLEVVGATVLGVPGLFGAGGSAVQLLEQTSAAIEDLYAAQTSLAAIYANGGQAEARRVMAEDTRAIDGVAYGLAAARGGVLHVEGAVVRGGGGGVIASQGAALEASKLHVSGVAADPSGGERHVALVDDTGRLSLRDARFEANDAIGVTALEPGSALDLARVQVIGPGATEGLAVGLVMQRGATGVIEDLSVRAAVPLGVVLDDVEVELVRSTIVGSRPDGAGEFGYGLLAQDEAELQLQDVALLDNVHGGLLVIDEARAVGEGVRVARTRAVVGPAIGVNAQRARLELRRVSVRDTEGMGLTAVGGHAQVEGLHVAGTRATADGFGDGAWALDGGVLVLSEFLIEDNARHGVVVSNGEAELSEGVIRGNEAGVLRQLEARVEASEVELGGNRAGEELCDRVCVEAPEPVEAATPIDL